MGWTDRQRTISAAAWINRHTHWPATVFAVFSPRETRRTKNPPADQTAALLQGYKADLVADRVLAGSTAVAPNKTPQQAKFRAPWWSVGEITPPGPHMRTQGVIGVLARRPCPDPAAHAGSHSEPPVGVGQP